MTLRRRRDARPLRAVSALALLAALVLTACGAGDGAGDGASADRDSSDEPADAGAISIVATTNVWGDIAADVLGDRGEVTALIADLARDPHDYEPTGRDELALSRADLVIVNGGGYDDVVDQMLGALGNTPRTIHAVDVAGRTDGNEHVWFDPAAAISVADAIATELAAIDPDHADDFTARATAFAESLADVRAQLTWLSEHHPGTAVAVAEPLPMPLVEAAGFVNVIDESFTEAMEEGIDVPPAELAEVLAEISERAVTMLIYNVQSTTPQSEQIRRAAEDAQVPVIEVTEILPPQTDYPGWIGGIVNEMISHLPAADDGSDAP